MLEQTVAVTITKHTNTHACALIILGPATEEETVDLKRGSKKDYSLWRYAAAAAAAALGDKASIHLGLNLRHSEEK